MKKANGARYSYLARLVVTLVCTMIVPLCVLAFVLWNRSYRETEKTVKAHYESMLSLFENNFGNMLREVKKNSVMLYTNSRSPLNIFYDSSSQLETDTYALYELQRQTSDLSELGVSEYGVIYHDLDMAVNRIGRFSIEKYQQVYLYSRSEKNQESLREWSSTCSFRIPNLRVTPITKPDGEMAVLVTYSGYYGKYQDPISVCYLIDSDDYFSRTGQMVQEEGTILYVTDSDGKVIFTAGAGGDGETCVPEFPEKAEEIGKGASQMVYCSEDTAQGFRYYVYPTEESMQADILQYYHRTRNIGILFAAFLILFGALGIYIEYRPIHQVTSELDRFGKDEIQSIRNALDTRSLRIREQEDIIMDSLLNHLIYGVPFPQNVGRKVAEQNAVYRVYMLDAPEFTVTEREELQRRIGAEFDGKLYISDLLGQKKYVLFSVVVRNSMDRFDTWMRDYVKEHFGEDMELCAGQPVYSLSEIRESYVSCYDSKKGQGTLSRDLDAMNLEKQHAHTTKKILEFIDQNFSSVDMSQTMVADALHVSNYTISRLFRSQIGIGFSEYVNGKRLAYAKEQLLQTNLPINEVALQAGFENARYFSKLFKASFNVSPSDFRSL